MKDRRMETTAGAISFHNTDRWLVPGEVEVGMVGDLVCGPRTVFDREPLEKVVFLYQLDGEARVRLSDVGELTLTKEEIIVIFPGRQLTVELTAASNRLMVVVLSGRGAVRAALGLGYWDLLRTSERYEGNFMTEIIGQFHAAAAHGRDERVLTLVEHLLTTIWLRIRHGSGRGAVMDAVRVLNRRICQGESLTTEAAAEALGVSRSKINALFKTGLGLRPGEFIERILTALAMAELFWTKTSVSRIAASFGFSSASAFATFLRRRIGQTPAAFRNQAIEMVQRDRFKTAP